MDPRELVERTLGAGREATQRSQERLESLVVQLQQLSADQLDQVAVLIGEVRDRSLLSGEQVAAFVDRRVRAQLAALGIATRDDLERLEGKVERLEGRTAGGAKKRDAGAGASKGKRTGQGTKGPGKAKAKGKAKSSAKHKSGPTMPDAASASSSVGASAGD